MLLDEVLEGADFVRGALGIRIGVIRPVKEEKAACQKQADHALKDSGELGSADKFLGGFRIVWSHAVVQLLEQDGLHANPGEERRCYHERNYPLQGLLVVEFLQE